MAQNQNIGIINAEDKAIMYRATKFIVYRNKNDILNEVTSDAFYTSKSKAVDHLRVYAEEIEKAVSEYKDYMASRRYSWRDIFVSLWVYKENEGRLVRTDAFPYKEVMDGILTDNSREPQFETL